MTTTRAWKRNEADVGHRLCPDCQGRGWCWLCEGRGWHEQPDGDKKSCSNCLGRGTCIVCEGEGQVWIKPYESAEPKDAPPAKRSVRLVARMREFGYDDEPSLVSLRDRISINDAEALARYLESGKLLMMSPGLVEDVLAPGNQAGSYSILTDGVFAWHEALAYFVRRYRVAVPPQLLEHARGQGYRISDNVNTKNLSIVES